MTNTHPVAKLRIARDLRQADAALDGALLKQDGLLATLITARGETRSSSLGQAELMRLVKSQQTLLSAVRGGLNDAGEVFPFQRKAA
jgi:hypothetical protein